MSLWCSPFGATHGKASGPRRRRAWSPRALSPARRLASPHVAIAGGGFAAVEAMLALRALAGERLRMTLISASAVLAYEPAATTEAFDETNPLTYDLRDLAGDLGVTFRLDRLESLASTLRSRPTARGRPGRSSGDGPLSRPTGSVRSQLGTVVPCLATCPG